MRKNDYTFHKECIDSLLYSAKNVKLSRSPEHKTFFKTISNLNQSVFENAPLVDVMEKVLTPLRQRELLAILKQVNGDLSDESNRLSSIIELISRCQIIILGAFLAAFTWYLGEISQNVFWDFFFKSTTELYLNYITIALASMLFASLVAQGIFHKRRNVIGKRILETNLLQVSIEESNVAYRIIR